MLPDYISIEYVILDNFFIICKYFNITVFIDEKYFNSQKFFKKY